MYGSTVFCLFSVVSEVYAYIYVCMYMYICMYVCMYTSCEKANPVLMSKGLYMYMYVFFLEPFFVSCIE